LLCLTIGCNERRFAPPLQPRRYKRGRVITVIVNFGTAYANEAKAKVNTNLIKQTDAIA